MLFVNVKIKDLRLNVLYLNPNRPILNFLPEYTTYIPQDDQYDYYYLKGNSLARILDLGTIHIENDPQVFFLENILNSLRTYFGYESD